MIDDRMAHTTLRTLTARARAWLRSDGHGSLVLALGVAFALRLGWAVATTTAPSMPTSDSAAFLRMATGFADRRMPSLGGHATAFWAPGWSLALAPVAWLSAKTGAISLPFAASLVNVVAGTATVGLAAHLALRWLGAPARNITAWVMALAPGPVYMTSSALSETWFTAVVLLTLVLLARALRTEGSTYRFFALGVLVGYAALVRTPGLVLVAAPLLIALGERRGWRSAARPTAAIFVGAVLVLVPWMVRNGVQVGDWTPVSANGAAFLCQGNRPGATGVATNDLAEANRCFRQSVFDNAQLYRKGEVVAGFQFGSPDEAAWYRRTTRESVRWMVTHLGAQPRLMARRAYETMASDSDSLGAAGDFGHHPVASGSAQLLLERAADFWYWCVLALGGFALVFLPRARRATPLWGIAVLLVAPVLLGLGVPRAHQPALPFIAALAGAAIVGIRDAGRVDRASVAGR